MAAHAARAARAQEIATSAHDPPEQGVPEASLGKTLFPEGRKLALEFVVIASLIALTAFLVYHFTTHTIVNRRPLGGRNIAVAPRDFDQSQLSFASAGGRKLVGASNDLGGEVLDVYTSTDRGATWTRRDGPVVPGRCAQGSPQIAVLPNGQEALAFLGAPVCGNMQSLTPFLVVSRRDGVNGRWSRIVRVAKPTWTYGFDDGPSLAASPRRGAFYLAWTRSLSKYRATTVVSASFDGGATWRAPTVVSRTLDRPHLATTAVAADGTLYVAGIDAKHGLWITASSDGGRTFRTPVSAARLLGNPSAQCAQTVRQPLPREARSCAGPDPTLLVKGDRLLLVYSDFGRNGTSDVFATALDRSTLKPLFHAQVNPPDRGKTQQLTPAAAVDASTGTVWACWYDSTYDSHAHRVWYTCAASRDGRTWTAPVAAASEPSAAADVYGTIYGEGLRTSVTAARGVAHAFWADSRNYVNGEDVETAAIPESRVFVTRSR